MRQSNTNADNPEQPSSAKDEPPSTEASYNDAAQPKEKTTGFTYGLIGWKGDPEVVRRIALDDEYGIYESPGLQPWQEVSRIQSLADFRQYRGHDCE